MKVSLGEGFLELDPRSTWHENPTRGNYAKTADKNRLRDRAIRHSADVRAYPFFRMRPGKHGVLCRARLTFKLSYAFTPEERRVNRAVWLRPKASKDQPGEFSLSAKAQWRKCSHAASRLFYETAQAHAGIDGSINIDTLLFPPDVAL